MRKKEVQRKNKSNTWSINSEKIEIILILAVGFIISFLLFKGPSIYGDDTSYLQYVPSILSGTFSETINVFSLRLLLDYPTAIGVAMLGYTDYGAGIYPLIAYLISIFLVYKIGKEVYNANAGLFSALLFAIYPLILKFNTDPDPMLPLVMFLLFSMLFFIYGEKYERYRQRNYLLTGIFAFAGALVNPLAYLYVVFFTFYIIAEIVYDSIREKKIVVKYSALLIYVGLITAIAIMGFINLYLANGKPFYELNMTNYYYSGAGGPDEIYYTNPSLSYYVNGYFSYLLIEKILVPILRLRPGMLYTNIIYLSNSIFNLKYINTNDVGFFGYFALLFGLYLLVVNDRKARFALIWAAFIVGYMEFGSMSITHYFPIYKLMRFTAIAAPALMLVIGIALARISRWKRKKIGYTIIAIVVIFLFVTSIQLDIFYYELNHNTMEYVKLAATQLLKAPNISNAHVFGPALEPDYLAYYMKYTPVIGGYEFYDNGAYGGVSMPTCDSIPNDSYIIIPSPEIIGAFASIGYEINENWAFNPEKCNLLLYSDIYSMPDAEKINGPVDMLYSGDIYYKP